MNNQNAGSVAGSSFQMVTLILNERQCSKFSEIIKEKGICHGIIIQGKGTVHNPALSLLGIRNQRQSVINILMEKEEAAMLLDHIADKLKISGSGNGIAYTTDVSHVGRRNDSAVDGRRDLSNTGEESMFKKLTVIVDRGMADDVMDIARKFGAMGGTILHGRGTGADCAARLFGMEIDPEKELIIILLPTAIVDTVTDALYRELELDAPGQGILFVESVSDVRGFVEVHEDKER